MAPLKGKHEYVFPAAPARHTPPQSGLRPASSPEGEAFNLPHRGRGTAAAPEGKALNLPHRGRGTAAAVEEGRYGRERCEKGNHGSPEREARVRISSRSRPVHPSSVSLTRASSTFCGIAATGSYFRFNSLRDAPPEGEAFNLPLRGRGTAAVGGGGRGALRERAVQL